MARLINAEALKAKYAWWANGGSDAKEWKDVFDFMVDHTPTAELEPTKHGRWIFNRQYGPVCSECGTAMFEVVGKPFTTFAPNYCPSCGAKMDEQEAAEIINDGTYSAGDLYECDPEKNTECNKRGCFINGGECRHTTRVEYAKEDRE